jgi:hypothetical protein
MTLAQAMGTASFAPPQTPLSGVEDLVRPI